MKCANCRRDTLRPTGKKYETVHKFADSNLYYEYKCDECGYRCGRKKNGSASKDKRFSDVATV